MTRSRPAPIVRLAAPTLLLIAALAFPFAVPSLPFVHPGQAAAEAAGPADGMVLEVFPLRNRPADTLVPMVEPLVGFGGSVATLDTRLVVRTTPRAMERVRRAVAELDVPLRALTLELEVRTTSSAVESRAASGANGASIQSHDEDGVTRSRLLGLEATPLFLELTPNTAGTALVPGPGGVAVVGGARDSSSGFSVVVWVQGRHVAVELRLDALAPPSGGPGASGAVRTSVGGRIGEWIDLGALLEKWRAETRGSEGARHEKGAAVRSIRVMVEARS